MGKGDKKTKRGKIIIGSHGVRRPKKKKASPEPVVKPVKKKSATKADAEEKKVKKTPAKAKKTDEKKAADKKPDDVKAEESKNTEKTEGEAKEKKAED